MGKKDIETERSIADAERRARTLRKLVREEPPACPVCGRMMTDREASSLGVCEPCHTSLKEDDDADAT